MVLQRQGLTGGGLCSDGWDNPSPHQELGKNMLRGIRSLRLSTGIANEGDIKERNHSTGRTEGAHGICGSKNKRKAGSKIRSNIQYVDSVPFCSYLAASPAIGQQQRGGGPSNVAWLNLSKPASGLEL